MWIKGYKYLLLGVLAGLYMGCATEATAPSIPAQIPTEVEFGDGGGFSDDGDTNTGTTTINLGIKAIRDAAELSVSKSAGLTTCSAAANAEATAAGGTARCYTPGDLVYLIAKVDLFRCKDAADNDVACTIAYDGPNNDDFAYITNSASKISYTNIFNAETTTSTSKVVTITDSTNVIRKFWVAQMQNNELSIPVKGSGPTGLYSGVRLTLGTVLYKLPEDSTLGVASKAVIQTVTSTGLSFDVTDLASAATYTLDTDSNVGQLKDLMFDLDLNGSFEWQNSVNGFFDRIRPASPVKWNDVNPTDFPQFYDSRNQFLSFMPFASTVKVEDQAAITLTLEVDIVGNYFYIDKNGDSTYTAAVDRISRDVQPISVRRR